MDELVPALAIGAIFIGLPWIILHYVTQWKKSATITREDENLLDELHEAARRLDDRLHSIERIIAADNPNWRLKDTSSVMDQIEDSRSRRYGNDI